MVANDVGEGVIGGGGVSETCDFYNLKNEPASVLKNEEIFFSIIYFGVAFERRRRMI